MYTCILVTILALEAKSAPASLFDSNHVFSAAIRDNFLYLARYTVPPATAQRLLVFFLLANAEQFLARKYASVGAVVLIIGEEGPVDA